MPEPSNDAKQRPSTAKAASWWALLGVGLLAGYAARPAVKPAPAGNEPGRTGQESARQDRVAPDTGRGRQADKPSEIPPSGWKDILFRVYDDLSSHRLLAVAAGVTFYALLALFPAVGAFVSLYGLFADVGTINHQLSSMAGVLPGGALDIIGEQIKRITSKPGGTLGFAFISGLAISLWSANAGVKAMFDALNVVYDETEKRSFIVLNALSLTVTIGAIVVLMLAIASVVVLPVVLKFVGLGDLTQWILTLGRWPLLLVVVILALAVLYRFGPSRDKVQWRWVSWGSVIAAVLWLVVSLLFSWYVTSFGNYNETYGSLGAAIGFMTWIWISTTVVLLGAEVNAEMEHQTEKDTTVGQPKPLGSRGATMADTVGAAKT